MTPQWLKSRWMHLCQYALLRLGSTIFQMFPIDLNLVTARAFGWVWNVLLKRHRRRAAENLRGAA